ncbi:hypothetical protein LWX53_04270 [bacterium]|nr:hypothetical protein [bacterium]
MRRGKTRAAPLLVIAVLAFLAAPMRGGAKLYAQETPASISPAATPIPITYAAGTEPAKAKDAGKKAWRAIVTGAGAFPFAYFYTNLVFDSVRFVSNGFNVQYAPWPFKTQYSAEVSVSETFIRLGVSAGLSAVVGILDAVVQR